MDISFERLTFYEDAQIVDIFAEHSKMASALTKLLHRLATTGAASVQFPSYEREVVYLTVFNLTDVSSFATEVTLDHGHGHGSWGTGDAPPHILEGGTYPKSPPTYTAF